MSDTTLREATDAQYIAEMADKYEQWVPSSPEGKAHVARLRRIAAALRAAEEDARDARRYRWLRSPKATNDWNRLGHYGVDDLDKQIDAATDAQLAEHKE